VVAVIVVLAVIGSLNRNPGGGNGAGADPSTGGNGGGAGGGGGPTVAELNSPVTVGDVRVTITDAKFSRSINQFQEPAAGHVFVAFEVKVEAVSGDTFVNSGDWSVAADGSQQGSWTLVIYDDWEPLLAFEELAEGNTITGWITFEVPEPDTFVELTYEESIFSSGPDLILRVSCCD
jgi:hypothetical protein